MSLDKLIRPESIAVIGVTDRPGSFGMNTALNVLKGRDTDRIYYVHEKRDEILGRRCYRSLSDLPERVDCAMLCTPGKTVNGLLRQAGELGVRAAVVFASGFSEELSPEGIRLEGEMVEIGRRYGMSILGPNCAGIVNNIDKIIPWGMGLPDDIPDRGTGVGVISQSGSIAATILHTPYIGVSYVISSGNGNVTTLEEFLEFLVEDDHVKVVSLYVEGVKDAEAFTRALRSAAQRRKPVVVLKGGKSERGASSAASHTGNLAGSARAYDSLFRKFGVMVADDLEQFMCMSQMLSVLNGNYPKKPTFAAITLSGGENVLFADLADRYQVELPDILPETKEELRKHLPEFATPKNPLDATTALFRDEEKVIGLLKAFEKEPAVGGVLLGGNVGIKISPIWKIFCESVAKSRKMGCSKPTFFAPPKEGTANEEYRKTLEAAGVPFLSSVGTGMRCLNRLAGFVTYDHTRRTLKVAAPEENKKGKTTVALSELESKEEMKRAGLPIPVQRVAVNREEFQRVLKEMPFPLVLKINSADILHKSDVGGVRLGIDNEVEALAAYDEIMTSVVRHAPAARCEGVLVQQMVPKGIEMIVGITHDIQFGPMLLVGLGGIFVEIFQDTSLYPLPLNREEALDMLRQLKGYKLLKGYRGGEPCDVEALAELMVKVSDYAYQHKDEIKELDLNPVFVYPEGKGVCAVDALLVKFSPGP